MVQVRSPADRTDAMAGYLLIPTSQLAVVGVAGLACLCLSFLAAVCARTTLDYPVALFLDGFVATRSLPKDLLLGLFRVDVLQGPLFVAAVWLVWFDTNDRARRARIATGVAGAALAGLLSRGLQLVLPAHQRPLHDAALAFVPPPWIDAGLLNHWNSFPSDHAALFFGLATVVCLMRPRLGLAVFAWALLVNLIRVYEGLHFLTDIIGGAGLGVAVVCLSQLAAARRACEALLRRAADAAGWFYAGAFLVTYEVAVLFEDVRQVGGGLARLLAGH